MKKGQTTVEFVFLIGLVAAGLIAMLVFIGRGHQGHVRSQADQLGARQYEPGNTKMDSASNWEGKGVTKTEAMESSTTVKHFKHPVGQENKALNQALTGIKEQMALLYDKMDELDKTIGPEGLEKAKDVLGGEWPWRPPGGGVIRLLSKIAAINKKIDRLNGKADEAVKIWPKREKDETSSRSKSMENSSIITDKSTDEIIGDFPDRIKPNIR
ncbi:MAG: hypothetical protein COV73_02565 [Candidatus Omnitrophica bacterium CG11_big_fil_rev_8_21_14_0_20_43_6]|nr:MAG: hypothetical protein COV73_02565 [Candidatus Omnitrophica bacterium CG11_big_fil_rev_8_21_14_0_20_43_6]